MGTCCMEDDRLVEAALPGSERPRKQIHKKIATVATTLPAYAKIILDRGITTAVVNSRKK